MRHAEKNIAKDFKDDSSQLLTLSGKEQAGDIGVYIKEQSLRIDQVLSSPIERCIETAKCIVAEFDGQYEIKIANELVCDGRGVFVTDSQAADKNFVDTDPLEVLVKLQQGCEYPGMASPNDGANKLLSALMEEFSTSNTHTLCISHDSILALFCNSLTNTIIDENNWFGYLEGIVLTMSHDKKFMLHWSGQTIDITSRVERLNSPTSEAIHRVFKSDVVSVQELGETSEDHDTHRLS